MSLNKASSLLPFLSLVLAAPHGPPTFPTNNKYTITSGGTHGNQGAHPVVSPAVNARSSELSTILPRNGVGSKATGNAVHWYTSDFSTGNSGYADPQYYYCFNGPAANFPPFANWMNFYDMFDLNQATSLNSEESGPLQGDLYNSIVQVSADSGVDARYILAIIMQESTGNLYVGCTNNGVENCGIMQAYAGSVSFNPNNAQASITQMVVDGTQGTSQGPGLVQWFNDVDGVSGKTGGNPYSVARGYNSGTIDFSNLSDAEGATASYVSDIANRLQGWNGNDGEGYRAACGF
ncbi:hypothetical protein D0Z07_0645 [Hyphodiscus hymeniophilus]|uniref:Transglycosylase SLT domain-containing protein n=1 Tax=Hyphodiscus hymeniophilus TaxID=353542 RepID=A0A9P6VRD1_9HELO|nr:hypothetical protein D0Z07_0645 [Hyphodiscus hymeniophilus]